MSIKHKIVRDTLREEILAGKYPVNARFPSESELLQRFGVSRPTIIHALRQLEQDGLIVRRRGSGTYLNNPEGRGRVFGMIVSNDNAALSVFPDICVSFAEECRRSGITPIANTTRPEDFSDYGEQAQCLTTYCLKQKVDGVIFQPVDVVRGFRERNAEIIRTLRENNVPVVLLDCDWTESPTRSDCDVVGIDNASAGHRVGEHLIQQGAQRIVFLAFEDSAQTVVARAMGVRTAMLDAGLPLENLTVAKWDPADTAAIETFLRDKPDAFACANDIVAARLIQTLQPLGVRIPNDVMVTGFDDTRCSSLLSPPLTTVRQPAADIGRIAFETLNRRIAKPDAPPMIISLTAPLIPRVSSQKSLS